VGGKALKGSLEGVLPMMGLLILAVVLSFQSLPIATSISAIIGESAEDAGISAESKSASEHIIHHYVPDVASFSVDNAAFETGQDNAGISWNSITSEEEIYSDIQDAWEEEANNLFSEQLPSRVENCEIQTEEYDLEIYPDTSIDTLFESNVETADLNVSPANSDREASLNCGDITYRDESLTHYGSTSNRYSELAQYAAKFYVEAEDQYDEASIDDSYTGTDSSCPGSGSRSDAEDQAESRYNSDTPSFSSVASEVSDPSETSSSGSTTDNYRVSFESEDTTCRVCSGEGEDRSCSQRSGSRVTATVTPTYSEMYMDIETDEEIVLNQAYRNLVLEVDEYSYSH